MKAIKLLSVVFAMVFAMNANAQFVNSEGVKGSGGSSSSSEYAESNQNYNRIILGWAPTKFSEKGESETLQGFDLGWIGGYNVTNEKSLPLYVETGLLMNAGFGECWSENDKLLAFSVPINATYRYHIKNTKIYVAPYFGFHFKVNALWLDDDGESYFDDEGTKRFQFGMQLGVNFDISKFNIGFGWDNDFMPIYKYSRYNAGTSGACIHVGVVF